MNITSAVEKGYFVKEKIDPLLIQKELQESEYDLDKAKQALLSKDYKWAIVKCYYSMFHSAKALCFSLGLREKKHIALVMMLEEMIQEGRLEKEYLYSFKGAMDAREGADYHYIHSEDTAKHIYSLAQKFNQRMKRLLE
ncbi:hypothetical protein A2642_00585 [Candidatus Nomurabacteria bacterium RIFCSPHIGHO2_01_FULL_39_10]|uniref:HEPN domain-containing protein n=1 Tax=Candidatus Nomurabacteria bacterium RIFCSPHIGHO2_01_FULL_39_10 TaxID=1801733 RepID=A0A1F6V5N4_9BACT|nr:MAG: hypothetical protein A2642_00585 [Candidatus Nomurabacteria bacterium RIFCSPHIGHO2_01_FULL_39_10]